VTRNPRGTVVSGVVRPDPKAARLLGERREMMVRFADIRETA
jgi:hypothetical protein